MLVSANWWKNSHFGLKRIIQHTIQSVWWKYVSEFQKIVHIKLSFLHIIGETSNFLFIYKKI